MAQATWDSSTAWDGGTSWALGVGELQAAPDAGVLADSGGALAIATMLTASDDAIASIDTGGSAHIVENLPVESSSPDYEAGATGRSWAVNSFASVQAWPTKLTIERVTALYDFAADLQPGDHLASVLMTVTLVAGTDAAPDALLYGLPQIKGRRVFQKLAGGVAGCVYLVRCQVTTRLDDVLVLARLLPVQSIQVH